MYFNAKISVKIGGIKLLSVVSVKANNDASHVGADCDIVIPLNCRIEYKDGPHDFLNENARTLFKTGDPVLIEAQYEGMDIVQVFSGFIYDFLEGTPLTIKCLDYIYFFNLGIFGSSRVLFKKSKKSKQIVSGTGASYQKISLQTLLQKLVDFVNDTIDEQFETADHISLLLPIPDFNFENLSFVTMSPAAILEWLKSNMGLCISLSGSKLYCNIASNTLDLVKLDTRINVIKSDLQKHISTFQRFKLKAWFLREDGTRDSIEVGDPTGTLIENYFYKLVPRTVEFYQKKAEEALLKAKLKKYNGTVELLLYPNLDLFWKVEYIDYRYPERNGHYTVMSIETELSPKGYHRKIKLAFLSELI